MRVEKDLGLWSEGLISADAFRWCKIGHPDRDEGTRMGEDLVWTKATFTGLLYLKRVDSSV